MFFLLTLVAVNWYEKVMKPNEIKAALVLRGITVTSIARSLGVVRPNVSQTIGGIRRTARIRQAIADAIELPVRQVFPDFDVVLRSGRKKAEVFPERPES